MIKVTRKNTEQVTEDVTTVAFARVDCISNIITTLLCATVYFRYLVWFNMSL